MFKKLNAIYSGNETSILILNLNILGQHKR